MLTLRDVFDALWHAYQLGVKAGSRNVEINTVDLKCMALALNNELNKQLPPFEMPD